MNDERSEKDHCATVGFKKLGPGQGKLHRTTKKSGQILKTLRNPAAAPYEASPPISRSEISKTRSQSADCRSKTLQLH
ncbi:hypothetical protein, partial [Sporolactobacillus sp. KGMB 08714]|uniref:hypothetical protein n=1 Tax=Sporolactobacillus sp. KGMB 08714 TaxID=3064704 RepID=UPI002FBDE285